MARPQSRTTWKEVIELQQALLARMPGDDFLATVLDSCVMTGRQKDNSLRGNFVASGLREAVGHVLHRLAPDEEVRACAWFVQAKDTRTVTRRQRADYIVHGGLEPNFVDEALNIGVADYVNPLLEAMDGLHKSTHVRPETVLTDGRLIREMFIEVVQGIDGLLDAAMESREAIQRAVADAMQAAVFENLILETIQALDELSTHTRVDGHYIDTVEVTALDAAKISYRVTGQVEVELQYGSNSDVENDIGYREDDEYPYEATVTCAASAPMTVRAKDIDLKVDNQSFYED